MVAGVCSNDANAQLKATTLFREILSKGNCELFVSIRYFLNCLLVYLLCVNVITDFVETNPPIEEIIQSGVVPLFVEFLVREDMPQLQVPTV
jgi:hypothetical protein